MPWLSSQTEAVVKLLHCSLFFRSILQENQGSRERGLESKQDKERKKQTKKGKNPSGDASPSAQGGKKKGKKGKDEPKEPPDEGDALATEGAPQSESTKKKKDKTKKGGVVIVDNAEGCEHGGALEGPSKAPKPRKSTLLLCDNAAAVALGNLVAIQVRKFELNAAAEGRGGCRSLLDILGVLRAILNRRQAVTCDL